LVPDETPEIVLKSQFETPIALDKRDDPDREKGAFWANAGFGRQDAIFTRDGSAS